MSSSKFYAGFLLNEEVVIFKTKLSFYSDSPFAPLVNITIGKSKLTLRTYLSVCVFSKFLC